jgi:hypothetical protein
MEIVEAMHIMLKLNNGALIIRKLTLIFSLPLTKVILQMSY